MNSLEKLLIAHGYSPTSVAQTRILCTILIRYLFRACYMQEVRVAMKPHGVNISKVVLDIGKSGYISKNLKLWIYWCYVNGGVNSSTVRKEFDVSEEDRRLAFWALTDQKLVKTLKKAKAPSLTTLQMDQHIVWIMRDTSDFLGKFINRKMSFLKKSYGVSLDDLRIVMVDHGIRSIYRTYPAVDSLDHLKNVCKRSMHNAGINLIQYHTAAKRNALIKHETGFQSRTISSSAVAPNVAEAWGSQSMQDMDERDKSISIKEFLSRCSENQIRLITVLSGELDAAFSEWLRQNQLVKTYTHGTVYEKGSCFASYIGVQNTKVARFIDRLNQLHS